MGILSNQRERTVSGETVVIKELRAIEAIDFVKRLSVYANQFQGMGSGAQIVEKLQEIIIGAQDVAFFLISKATGKPEAWVGDLGLADFLDVLQDTPDLTINEDVVKKVTRVAAQIRSLAPKKATPTLSENSPRPLNT